ncbi:MAG: HEAT repeat domain-containing protein [Bradymonadia bacterium]
MRRSSLSALVWMTLAVVGCGQDESAQVEVGSGQQALVTSPNPGTDTTNNPISIARRGSTTGGGDALKGTGADSRLVGLSTLIAERGGELRPDGIWPGSGMGDPLPIRHIKNEDMLAVARGAESKHPEINQLTAMVSVARRRLPEAIGILTEVLKSRSSAWSSGEVTEQSLSDTPGTNPLIVERFRRNIAVSGLIEIGGPEALAVLWQAMGDEPDPMIRQALVGAIALNGTSEAMKVIDLAMADENPGVRGMGVLSLPLVRNNGDYVWRVLETAVNSPEMRVYQEATYILGEIADERAVKMLSDALDSAGSDPKRKDNFRHYLRVAYKKRAAAGATASIP